MRQPLDTYTKISTHYADPVPGSFFGKHLGTDYAVAIGAPVYMPASGTVRSVLTTYDVGKQIEVSGDDGYYYRFLHLSRQDVAVGQNLAEGQLIGLSGDTGAGSTGPHLHLDIRKPSVWSAAFSNYIDPEQYLKGSEKEHDMVTDIGMVRQMAQSIGGRGFGGRTNAWDASQKDLQAHVGKDAGQEFSAWYNSDEAKKWRDKELPEIYRKAAEYDKLAAGSKGATPKQLAAEKAVDALEEALKS